MKPKPLIVWSLLLVFGILMIPTATGWVVRDFLTQTMQLPADFEHATIDPIKGNLVLNNFVLHRHSGDGQDGDSDANSQSLNKVEKIWANYSLSQLLYRRFDAPLILMDGVQIGSCDTSRSVLPRFQSKAKNSVPPVEAGLTNSTIYGMEAAIAKASFHRALEKSTSRSVVSKESCIEEISRLKKGAQPITTASFDRDNPLRSTWEAKRAQVELKKIEARLTELKQGLDRESNRLAESLPIARENVLVDWMGWNNAKLNEIEAINRESLVEMLLSNYAVEWIKPLVAPLTTTHALSRWSVGQPNEAETAVSGTKSVANLDMIDAGLRTTPFRFKTIRLRGRTLLGLEPLAMSGSIKQTSTNKEQSQSAGPVTLELQFDRSDVTRTKSVKHPDGSIVVSSKYEPTSHVHQIDLQHRLTQVTNQQLIAIGTKKHVVETTLRASNPALKLNWTLRENIWECRFEMDCSNFDIAFMDPPDFKEPIILRQIEVSGKKPSSNWQWKKQQEKIEEAFLQVTYRGRLEDGKFDNCDETIRSIHSPALANALREYWKQRAQNNLIAAKAL